jgi:Leucine-rich repeat (LRR) protein
MTEVSFAAVFSKLLASIGVKDISECTECKTIILPALHATGVTEKKKVSNAHSKCPTCQGSKRGQRAIFTFDPELYDQQATILIKDEIEANLGELPSAARLAVLEQCFARGEHQWSPEAQSLKHILQISQQKALQVLAYSLSSQLLPLKAELEWHDAAFVHRSFKTLSLKSLGLTSLDSSLASFDNLTELSVTGNLLRSLQNLPPRLQILQAFANSIETIQVPKAKGLIPPLIHLGLGFNCISQCSAVIILIILRIYNT